jgi:hypothetical protein
MRKPAGDTMLTRDASIATPSPLGSMRNTGASPTISTTTKAVLGGSFLRRRRPST